MEVCEIRPKYTYNIMDAIIVDTVEFVYRASCNTTESDPFNGVFGCFSKLLAEPRIQLQWQYRKTLPPVIGLKNFLCS